MNDFGRIIRRRGSSKRRRSSSSSRKKTMRSFMRKPTYKIPKKKIRKSTRRLLITKGKDGPLKGHAVSNKWGQFGEYIIGYDKTGRVHYKLANETKSYPLLRDIYKKIWNNRIQRIAESEIGKLRKKIPKLKTGKYILPKPKPKAKVEPEPQVKVKPEPGAKLEPEPEPEPKAKVEPGVEPGVEPEPFVKPAGLIKYITKGMFKPEIKMNKALIFGGIASSILVLGVLFSRFGKKRE